MIVSDCNPHHLTTATKTKDGDVFTQLQLVFFKLLNCCLVNYFISIITNDSHSSTFVVCKIAMITAIMHINVIFAIFKSFSKTFGIAVLRVAENDVVCCHDFCFCGVAAPVMN